MPNSIGNLKELELVNFGSNKLTELPDSFSNFPKIWKLNLDENQLKKIPANFATLQSLKDLSVAKNKITEVEADALMQLNQLEMLDLHQNCFSGTYSSVPKSEKLDRLILGFN